MDIEHIKNQTQRISNLLVFLDRDTPKSAPPTRFVIDTNGLTYIGEWTDTDWSNGAICIKTPTANGKWYDYNYILVEHIRMVRRSEAQQ